MAQRTLLTILLLTVLTLDASAQCPTTNITGNFSPANGDTLQGIYNITGNFTIGPGITVYVRPYSMNNCGSLEVYAGGNIFIAGTISANGAGNTGGALGAAGLANNITHIEQCSSPTDQCADLFPFGGAGGGSAFGSGGGLGGTTGQNGSGRKDRCLNFGDEGGRVGGAGGAGAGAGGSYGGNGTIGANGGNGSVPTMSTSDVGCSFTPIAAGAGSPGGLTGAPFGTNNGTDIALGAGGGGAGGGGRGRTAGTAGGPGGNGGGLIKLVATGTFTFSGTIHANGLPGQTGGNGGNAGASTRCCVDACNGVDEYTHTGAGGGGGGGGGGSGGGVLLEAGNTATITGTINCLGGGGAPGGNFGAGYTMNQNCIFGNSNANAGPSGGGGFGGGGSGGRIKVFFNPCAANNVVTPGMTVTGGNGNGGTAQAGTTFTGPLNALAVGAAAPALQTVCFNGDPGNLNSLPATGGLNSTYTYQWQSQTDCNGPWANIPGANALNYDPPAGLQDTTCYRLQVQSGACTSFSDTLRVDVIAAVSVTVNPPGPIAACLGDSIPLTTSGGTGATYQWYYNGSPISQATDSFFIATASGSYTVITSFPVGCDGQSQPVVTTFSPPPAAFAVALGDTIYCPGHPLDLLAVGNGTFQWLLNGSPIPGATNANLSVNAPGNYAVEVTISGGCTSTSAPITITPGVLPTATMTVTGDTTFCFGDSVLFTASGGSTYAWLQDSTAIPAATDSTFYATNTGLYQAIAISPDGCTDTTAAVQVIADPSPTAILNPAGLPVTCTGDSVVFYATGGGTYTWLYNGSPLPDTTPYYHAGITGDYTVIVTNSAGCSDTSVTFAFSYYPPVLPAVTPNGPAYICPGDTVGIEANGAGAVAWTWLHNDTLVQGADSTFLAASEPGAYSAIAYDQFGCEYPSVLVMVYPGQDPDAGLTLIGDPPLCANETVLLVGSGGGTYQWLQDSVLVPGLTDSVFQVTVAGDYQVVVTNGCGADTSSTVYVEAGIAPIAGFEYENYPASLVQLWDRSISGATWHWDFGDGTTSNEQNPFHQYPNPGDYQVTMITWDVYGCADTISMLITVTDPDFFIPNVFSPNGDGINDVAQTNFRKLTDFTFTIYDRWGNRVFQTDVQDTWWDGKVNGNDAPDGVYYYYLQGQLPQEREAEQRGPITLVR